MFDHYGDPLAAQPDAPLRCINDELDSKRSSHPLMAPIAAVVVDDTLAAAIREEGTAGLRLTP